MSALETHSFFVYQSYYNFLGKMISMYDEITNIYQQIFPLNQAFLQFLSTYLKKCPSALLDLGCGPGDYVHALSQAGHHVVGIDNSAQMIYWAKQHNKGTFFHLSFSEIGNLKERFDCIYCIGNSLSYLPYTATHKFLQDVFNLLNYAGVFLLQLVNWDKYRLSGSMDFPIQYLADGRGFQRTYEPLPDSSVLFKTSIQKDGQILQTWSDQLFPRYADSFPKEIEKSSLRINGIYGDFQRNPFDPSTSPALIITAEK